MSPVSVTAIPVHHGMPRPMKKAALFGGALMAVTFIGVLDQATGWELSLFVLYGVPIFFVVWFSTWKVGMVFSLLCAVIWWLANQAENPYVTWWGYQLAALSRFVYFSMVVVGGAILKMKREADAVRIDALEKMHEMEREIVRVSEREQRRIGQDLHDGLCQHLAAIGCAAKSLADDLQKDGIGAEAAAAGEIVELIKGAVIEVREVARGMFPVQVDLRGLGAALDDLAATTSRLTSAVVTFTEVGEVLVSETEYAMHLYRIAQEAVSNAIKHGQADHIAICLSMEDGVLFLTIDDDGRGFFVQPGDPSGMGLRTMAYRARSIGASLEISERDGPGTRVLCTMPLPQNPPSEEPS